MSGNLYSCFIALRKKERARVKSIVSMEEEEGRKIVNTHWLVWLMCLSRSHRLVSDTNGKAVL